MRDSNFHQKEHSRSRSRNQRKEREYRRKDSNLREKIQKEKIERKKDHNADIDNDANHHQQRRQGNKKHSPLSATSPVKKVNTSHTSITIQKEVPNDLNSSAQFRISGGPSINPLEKAAVHAAQYLSMDPLEKMRRQVEQTLEAKLGLLQTKLDNARDPKNKTQRKIYIGNLTPNINGEFLK